MVARLTQPHPAVDAPAGVEVVASCHTVPVAHSGSISLTVTGPPASMMRRLTLPAKAALRLFSGRLAHCEPQLGPVAIWLSSEVYPRKSDAANACLSRLAHVFFGFVMVRLQGNKGKSRLTPGTNASFMFISSLK